MTMMYKTTCDATLYLKKISKNLIELEKIKL